MPRDKTHKDASKADSNIKLNELIKSVVQIKQSIDEQKENINKMNEIISNQNKVIIDLISEVKVIVKTNMSSNENSSKYAKYFPICTEDELKDLEAEICEETKDAMISTLKKITCFGGLRKNIKSIFDLSMLLQFNVDGRQGKKRLLNYPKTIDILYRTVQNESMNKSKFIDELRKSVRLAKNTHYKIEHAKRQGQDVNDNSFINGDVEM